MKLADVELKEDQMRGCGKRKAGGLYIVTEPGHMAPCGKLPIVFEHCPCCGSGIYPTRSYQHIDLDRFLEGKVCDRVDQGVARVDPCIGCPLHTNIGKVYLLWIGEKFYPTPDGWMEEARRLGVSRRMHQIPRGLKLGESWIAVAHRKAVRQPCPECGKDGFQLAAEQDCGTCDGTGLIDKSAIFHLFQPTAIEYICKGTETEQELDALVKRGIKPIRVVVEGQEIAEPVEAETGSDI